MHFNSPTSTIRRVSLATITLVIALAVIPGAMRQQAQPPDQLAWVGRLPASVGAVVVIDHASRLSREPSGRAAARLLEEAGFLQATSAAWDGLAQALGMDGPAAFDALLGTRAAVLLSSIDAAQEINWAAMALVDKATETRLRNGLRPAPRAFVLGHHVLAVENGRYELVLRPALDRREATLVILAPANSSAFFDALLAAISGNAPAERTLDAHPAWDMIRSVGPGDLLAIIHETIPSQVTGTPPQDRFSAISASVVRDGFTARVVGHVENPGPQPVEAVPSGWFDMVGQQFTQSAFILMSAAGNPGAASAADSVTGLLSEWLGVPKDLYGRLGPGIVLAIEPLPDPVASRNGAEALRGVGLAMTIGVEVQGDAALAACDRCMATLLAPPQSPSQSPPVDFDGEFPEAVRVMKIAEDPPSRLSAVLAGPGAVAWSYTPLPERADNTEKRGWWIVRIFPGERDDAELAGVRRLDAVLAARSAGGVRGTRVMSVTLKPALLQRALSRGGLLSAGPLAAVRWIDRIDWDTRLTQPGIAEGELQVRMNLKLLDDPTQR